MTKIKKKYDYAAVNLPRRLLDRIDYFKMKYPDEIRTRADFVKRAIEGRLSIYEIMGSEVKRKEDQKRMMDDFSLLEKDTIKGKLDEVLKRIEKLEKKKK